MPTLPPALTPVEEKLLLGMAMSREEAAWLLQQPDLKPALFDALRSSEPELRHAAARLCAALGDAAAVPILRTALMTWVPDPDDQDDSSLDPVAEALGALPGGLDALVHVIDKAPLSDVRTAALLELQMLAEDAATDHSRIVRLLLGWLETSRHVDVRSEAALALTVLNVHEARPALEKALQQGRLDEHVFGWPDLDDWLNEPRDDADLPSSRPDPLAEFSPAHRAALRQYREALAEEDWQPLLDMPAFILEANELRQARPAPPAAGRNDPCPCGSGRKFKKCCLGQEKPDLIRLRLGALRAWLPYGYRWLPSQQIEGLGTERVAEHLALLALSWSEVQARARAESDPYLLWSLALRSRALGQTAMFADLAYRIVLADGQCPALDYQTIEYAAAVHERSEGMVTRAFDTALSQDRYPRACGLVALCPDPGEQQRLYARMLDRWPEQAWTALMQAEDLDYWDAATCLSHLQTARQRILAGSARGWGAHPPPSLSVVDAFISGLEQRQDATHRMQRLLAELRADPLEPSEHAAVRNLARDWRTLHRHAQEQGWGGAHLEERLSDWREQVDCLLRDFLGRGLVLLAETAPGTVTAVVPDEDTAALVSNVFTQVAEETDAIARQTATADGTWRVLTVTLTPVPDDMPDLLVAVLGEQGGSALELPPRLVEAVVPPAPEAAPPACPRPEEALSLVDYVKRTLLRLIRMNKIGEAHTRMGYFWRGAPTHWRGAMKAVLDAMVDDGLVRLKPTLKETHISLEPTGLPTVWRFLRNDVLPPGRTGQVLQDSG